MSLGMSHKPNVHQLIPGTSGTQAMVKKRPSEVQSCSPDTVTKMYLFGLKPALFRVLHDAPTEELIDLITDSLSTPSGQVQYCNEPSQAEGSVGNLATSAANLATLQSYRPLLSDYGPPTLGFPQGSTGSQVPQNKYAELLAIIEELGKEIRPTYAGSKSAMERLKRGIIHARGLVRECLAETERNARS